MKKYLAVFKTSFQRALEYRARAVVWIFVDMLTPLFLAIVFAAAVKSGETIGNFNRSSFVMYFLILILFKNFISTHKEEDFNEHVKSGNISNFLVKPVDYFLFQLFGHFGWAVSKIIISIPVFLLLLFTFHGFVGLDLSLSFNPFILLIFLFLSTVCDFCYSMLLGLSSFWLIENFALYSFVGILVFIASGSLVPLELFPTSLRNVILLTPFPHLLYSPVKMALGLLPPNALLFSFGTLIFWVIIFFLVYSKLWRKGLKIYEGLGL